METQDLLGRLCESPLQGLNSMEGKISERCRECHLHLHRGPHTPCLPRENASDVPPIWALLHRGPHIPCLPQENASDVPPTWALLHRGPHTSCLPSGIPTAIQILRKVQCLPHQRCQTASWLSLPEFSLPVLQGVSII